MKKLESLKKYRLRILLNNMRLKIMKSSIRLILGLNLRRFLITVINIFKCRNIYIYTIA